jgi:hypothetical protein
MKLHPDADLGRVVICPNPNCGFRGEGTLVNEGSVATAVLLFLCGILPGLLYVLFAYKTSLHCPQCGVFVRRGDVDGGITTGESGGEESILLPQYRKIGRVSQPREGQKP